MTVQWIPVSERNPELPYKEMPVPRWLTNRPERDTIRKLADQRTYWFEIYANGGKDHPDPKQRITKRQASQQIVELSQQILAEIIRMGREPIAEGGEQFVARPPETDMHWINQQKQAYSLYTTVHELRGATQNVMLQRQVLLENIPIKDLLQGNQPKRNTKKD